MSNKITLLDYGMGNLLNVARAFEHFGSEVTITEDPLVAQKPRNWLCQVGAFRDSMLEIESRGFGRSSGDLSKQAVHFWVSA